MIALLLLCSISARPFAADLLIHNVTVIDSESAARPAQDVLVRDGTISAVGPHSDHPADLPMLDGSDRYLIPGLWDMHVHLSYDPRLAAHMGDLFLDYGITSVRDTGGQLDVLLPIVKEWRSRGTASPQVFYAGPLLDGSPVVYDGNEVPSLGQRNLRPEEAAATIERLLDAGVSFVKIYEMVTPEVFQALADAAASRGLPVAAHVPLTMLASQAAPSIQSMEHLRNIELDCAADAETLLTERRERLAAARRDDAASGYRLRQDIHSSQRPRAYPNEDPQRCNAVIAALRHTIQVPTARLTAMTDFPPFAAGDWAEALSGLPEELALEWSRAPQLMDPTAFGEASRWTLAMIPRLAATGVPIGAGTDTPIGWAIPGYSLHRELQILVAAGLTPRQALRAATVVPARFLRLDSKMGLIREGHRADLLLLGANPLESIDNTRRIEHVIVGGSVVRSRVSP